MPGNFGDAGESASACSPMLSLALIWLRNKELDQCRKRSPGHRKLATADCERDQERAEAQAFLDLSVEPQHARPVAILNGLIQRKAFSWTRVFEDLEQVMPPNLHVVSLRPELNDQNSMQLDMKVVGDNRSAAVESGSPHGRIQAFSRCATGAGSASREPVAA